jgi:hypothetical protein
MANQPKRGRSPTNFWDVLRHLITRAFNSGYALFVLGGAIFLGSLWIVAQRLDPKDLKDLIGGVLDTWSTGLGWLLFLVGSSIYLAVLRWTRIRYEAEIERQREMLDRLLPPDKRKELDLE